MSVPRTRPDWRHAAWLLAALALAGTALHHGAAPPPAWRGGWGWSALGGGLLYLASHLLRGLRLRLAVAINPFTTRQAATVQMAAAGLGNLTVPWLKELGVAGLFLLLQPGQLPRILLALIYTRAFDFLVIISALLLLSNGELLGFLLLLLVLLLILVTLLGFLPRLCALLIAHLVRHHHTPAGLILVRWTAHVREVYTAMGLNRGEVMVAVLLLTLLIWAAELLSVALVLGGLGAGAEHWPWQVVFHNLATNIPHLTAPGALVAAVYHPLYLGLAAAALPLALLQLTRRHAAPGSQ